MSFDQTANYFYFFDSNRRYVIDVVNRKVFGTNILTQRYYSVGLCDRNNYLDISATMNQNGMITIWDDYGQLVSYSAGVSVR